MNRITVEEIIKMFKIQKPTTGRIELQIIADQIEDVKLSVICTKDEEVKG